ncbi:hypothetical protein AVEN_232152-1 [Araneus ventricosus]|uniref:Uncharacterized protein n=1 Tax=Araneus ventricosus TaxID=182803 RepID=A0A4Y2G0R0_ARAVE|nr:hypothetical protein AVEN_232152-1 [Araneus ventricosus]
MSCIWLPNGGHHEYADEKPPDKKAVSRFPGGYNNGWGLPSAGDSACLQWQGSGCGRRWPLELRPQHSICRSDCHSDALDSFAPGRGDCDMKICRTCMRLSNAHQWLRTYLIHYTYPTAQQVVPTCGADRVPLRQTLTPLLVILKLSAVNISRLG